MRLRSVVFGQLMGQNPEMAVSIMERHGLSIKDVRDWHVLFIQDPPYPDAEARQRAIITAAIIRDPIDVELVGVGTALKCPDDVNDSLVGASIALARAVRDQDTS